MSEVLCGQCRVWAIEIARAMEILSEERLPSVSPSRDAFDILEELLSPFWSDSSASSQHYIDTGVRLITGEEW